MLSPLPPRLCGFYALENIGPGMWSLSRSLLFGNSTPGPICLIWSFVLQSIYFCAIYFTNKTLFYTTVHLLL